MDKFVRDNEVVYRAICINGLDKSKDFFDASNIFLTNSIDGCSVDRDDNRNIEDMNSIYKTRFIKKGYLGLAYIKVEIVRNIGLNVYAKPSNKNPQHALIKRNEEETITLKEAVILKKLSTFYKKA